jgi:hypothetical protein
VFSSLSGFGVRVKDSEQKGKERKLDRDPVDSYRLKKGREPGISVLGPNAWTPIWDKNRHATQRYPGEKDRMAHQSGPLSLGQEKGHVFHMAFFLQAVVEII